MMQSNVVGRIWCRVVCLIAPILIPWAACASAQFADPNLEAAVNAQLAGTSYTLASMPILDASGRGITRLDGIEQCTGLDSLVADYNFITSVAPLLALTALTFVGLTDNPFSEGMCADIETLRARGVTVAYEPDADGDGLYTCDEIANGTDPNNPDTDGDGMSDGYEVQYGLKPLDDSDAIEDPDADGLTNLDESLLRSNPNDAASPYPAVWVSKTGVDAPGRGTLAAPWSTIQYGIDHVSPTSAHPATVLVGPGTYAETVALSPYIRLQGDAEGVVVQGTVAGAEGATLCKLTLRETAGKASDAIVLLTLDNIAMQVRDVVFQGVTPSQATGIVFRGDGPGRALVEDCKFQELHRGIEIFGALPTLRRSVFHGIIENGIIVRQTAEKAASNGSMGDASDPNTGWNTFQETGEYDIVNERSQSITMQRNNWGTDSPATRISGNVIYDHPLAVGTPLIPASVVCNISDANSMEPITNGKVLVGSFSPVTNNTNGVYIIACLAAGDYGLGVSANSYLDASRNVAAKSGEVAAVVMPIKKLDSGEGEGEGEGETPHSCVGGTLDARNTPLAGPWNTGDGLLLTALVVALAAIAIAVRKQTSRHLNTR